MKSMKAILIAAVMALAASTAYADKYDDAIANFKTSGKAASFFAKSYAYAIFPDVGKAGFIVGGEHGDGKVYEQGKLVGTASLTQVSVGAQAGAKEYSEVIFFETKADFDKFRAGEFQLSGNAEATAITLSASASAGTDSSTASAGTEADTSAKAGGYQHGVAVFTVTKGGLMAGISVGGQKLKFKPTK